jgi:hypothetical protein
MSKAQKSVLRDADGDIIETDVDSLTTAELKSILTRKGHKLPATEQKKQVRFV